jgi:hypothetical protein
MTIGSIIGIIVVTAILCVVAYDMGINASRPQIEPFVLDTSIPPWQPPEFEFKIVEITVGSMSEIADAINKQDNCDNRFYQILSIDKGQRAEQGALRHIIVVMLFRCVKSEETSSNPKVKADKQP